MILVLITLLTATTPEHSGFAVAKTTLEVDLGKSQDADGNVRLRCWVFDPYAIVEIDDPAIKGARVEVRSSTLAASARGLCEHKLRGGRVIADDEVGAFVGTIPPFVVLEGVDGFGIINEMAIVDARSGKRIYEGPFAIGRPFRVASHGKTVSFDFTTALTAKCMKGNADRCWAATKHEHNLPTKLKTPTCKGTQPVQIALPAHIADLANPKLEVVGDAIECVEQP